MHFILSLIFIIYSQSPDQGWDLFSETRYRWQYVDDLGLEIEMPVFDKKVQAWEGKEITLTGHYLPFDMEGNRIMLSKMPYAQCFFCGGAGPESVVEVFFEGPQRRFKPDELLTIKGKLKLNAADYEHMIFMITDATIVSS